MEILTILFWSLIALLSAVFVFFKRRFNYWKDRGVPHIEPKFPFGNLPARQIHFKDMTTPIYQQQQAGSPFMGAFFFTVPVVIATDLDFVQSVLVRDFGNFHERGMYVNEADDPLSGHMFSLDGEKWKSLRSKLSPTFTSGKMKFMFPTIVDIAERFVSVIGDQTEQNRIVEIKELLARFTTDIIGTCAFGIECNSLKDPNSDFRRYGAKFFDEPYLGPWLIVLAFQYPELARKLHVRTMQKDVSDFFLGLVRETIAYREKNNVRSNDFMDLLIRLKNGESIDDETTSTHPAKGQLTFEEVAAQAFIFFLAGFETSSTTMMFALYELALNPDIQARAHEEIERVLNKYEGKLTYECLKEIGYLRQIVDETLRMYPPIANIVRKTAHDYQVPNSNLKIEKGMSVFVPVYAIQHNPEIYPDPEVFDPERFADYQVKSRHPMSFLSFGDGPRNCIGARFGRMQTYVGLIYLLKNFRFKACSKTPIPMEFSTVKPVLQSKYDIFLEVEKI